MRRHATLGFLVAAGCLLQATQAEVTIADETARTKLYRSLTNEHPEAAVSYDWAEESSPATSPVAQETAPTLISPQLNAPQPISAAPATALQAAPRAAPRPATPVYVQQVSATMPVSAPRSFYPGASAQATLSQFPRRVPVQSNPQRTARTGKPFTQVESSPTLSPYLNLDRDEDDTQNVPNYFTLVRPQFEQIQKNRSQQQEIQQLRGQLQSMTASAGSVQYQASGTGGMRTSAHYMDTGQFYRGMR